mmetsp:Transcript_44783/g.85640  ORF Transcript_44783/g.85640 Transcript_44783/m.85640 type:complete len:338 (-) Transcript_44783:178-1191(-)
MSTFKGFVVPAKGQKLELRDYPAPPLGDNDVDIQVTHNGLCHTDCHMRDNDWGNAKFPFVPGHEVVGVVKTIGKNVRFLKEGDRVGYGWIKDSCRNCTRCIRGQENLCKIGHVGLITLGSNGGFQPVMRAPADFAFKLPEALDSASAAPLLCAGVTVYAPLKRHITFPGMKVGVLGIGGLGHMAVQIAAKLGAEVIAISGSKDKEAECLAMGASSFVTTGEANDKLTGELDLLINCVSAKTDYAQQMGWLAHAGTLCIVGLPVEEITVPLLGTVFYQKSVTGSIVGGRDDVKEMLQFCAVHGIKPLIETMPLSQINEAMDRVVANKARYRIVLTTDV